MFSCLLAATVAYGVNAHICGKSEEPSRTTAEIRTAGFGAVRADFCWGDVEKKTAPGVFDFSKWDDIVAKTARNGVLVLPATGWGPVDPVANPERWAEYLRRFVSRYRAQMPVIEIWNEENVSGFWKDPNPTNYVQALKTAYRTIKAVDPSVRVSFGGTSGVPLDYIEEAYRNGAKDFFDIMAVHPYSHPYQPEKTLDVRLEKLRELMAKYGDAEKPVWITELGMPTIGSRPNDADSLVERMEQFLGRAKPWRCAYIHCGNIDSTDPIKAYLVKMPRGSTGYTLHPDEAAEKLRTEDYDAVFYGGPYYDPTALDAVLAFVAKGGVMVAHGGPTMKTAWKWNPMRPGLSLLGEKYDEAKDRARLDAAVKAGGRVVLSSRYHDCDNFSDEYHQALYLPRMMGLAFAEGVEAFYIYEFRQPDRKDGDRESYFGIVHDNFAPTPALGSVRTFIAARPEGSVRKKTAWHSANREVFYPQWTCPDGQSGGMLWTTREPFEKELRFTTDRVVFTDYRGYRIWTKPGNGNAYRLRISGEPVYFKGGELCGR